MTDRLDGLEGRHGRLAAKVRLLQAAVVDRDRLVKRVEKLEQLLHEVLMLRTPPPPKS